MTAGFLAEPTSIVRDLFWTRLPIASFKYAGMLGFAAGLGLFVWFSSTDPRGGGRRLAGAYVSRVDADLRANFQPARGAQIAWFQLCGVLALLAIYGFVPRWPVLVLALLAALGPPLLVARALAKRRERIDDQSHGFALALANSLKTTASVADALWVTLSITENPIKQELETMLKQVRVGSTMEEALLAMSVRTQSPALDVIVSALLIGRQTGGDLPRILEQTSNSLREIKRLEELTAKTLYQSKQSYAISAGLTLATVWFLPVFMPGFLDPLRDTRNGQLVAAWCALAFLGATYMAYRFTRSDI